MLSYKHEQMINEILKDEYAEEIVLALTNRFAARSPKNCRTLIKNNDRIADKMMQLQQEETNKASEAVFWAISQKAFNRNDSPVYFASMVPVCKVLFPTGTAENESVALRKYFREFVKLLHNPKVFDIKRDRSWAEQLGYLDYLDLVMKNTAKEGVYR